MNKRKPFIIENIAKKLIFVDGVSRNGKSLFVGILPSLERVEHINVIYLLEQTLPAVSLGILDAQYLKVLMRLYLNELAYNIQIGRNVNFRYTDHTGVLNYKDPQVYYKRLSLKEGDTIVEKLLHSDLFIPFKTHDLLVNLEYLNLLDIDYKMLAMFRHPIDNIYSWWKIGWGRRFGIDPRAFTLAINYHSKPLPWYCAGYEDEWLTLNEMERCVLTVTDLITRSIEQYKKSTKKDRIHLLTFEGFVQKPYEELEKICLFLDTEKTIHTPHFIRLANCPRELDSLDRERKFSEIKTQVKKELFHKVTKMSDLYETNLYGLL